MRKLLIIIFLLLGFSPFGKTEDFAKDPRILCIRNQVKFDIEQKAYVEYLNYIYGFKSIDSKEFKKVQSKWYLATDIEKESKIPILKLAGFKKPSYYLEIFNSNTLELQRLFGLKNRLDVLDHPDYKIAQEYFGKDEIGDKTRDTLCKSYGIEFKYRNDEVGKF